MLLQAWKEKEMWLFFASEESPDAAEIQEHNSVAWQQSPYKMSESLQETHVGLAGTSDLTAASVFAGTIAGGFRWTNRDCCDYIKRAEWHPSRWAVPSSSEGTQGSRMAVTNAQGGAETQLCKNQPAPFHHSKLLLVGPPSPSSSRFRYKLSVCAYKNTHT